jgi:8-oxo-dGTP diphosphatase
MGGDKVTSIPVVAGIIELNGKLLICRRKKGGDFPLKWEFPGGKVELQERATDALKRELLEELGIRAEIGEPIGRSEHNYPGGASVSVWFFRVLSFQGKISKGSFDDVRWVCCEDLIRYDFLEADVKLVRTLSRQMTRKRDWKRGITPS